MQPSVAGPIAQGNRVVIVDILRGWALLGVVLMNYTDIYFFLGKPRSPDGFNSFLQLLGNIIFQSKSWTLLSFLFGYGFAVLIGNVAAKGINPLRFFTRRMFWLLVLAFINSIIFFGDILKDYAVFGMVLLMFRRINAKTAFYISLVLLIINPAVLAYVVSLKINGVAISAPYFALYNSHNLLDVAKCGLFGTYSFEILNPGYLIACHVIILLCFFLGLAAQKTNFFGRLAQNKKYIKRIFWASLAVAVLMWALFITVRSLGLKNAFTYYHPLYFLILSSMVFITCAICWLYMAGKLKRFFAAMQVYGKMTLTNYVVQNILGVVLFSGIGLRLGTLNMSYGSYMLIALAIYIAQVYFSKWWLKRYNYGPIEWIWRQLSYGKKIAIKKEEATRN